MGLWSTSDAEEEKVPGQYRPDLPTIKLDDVAKHKTKPKILTVYDRGVYDVSEFVARHPGGPKILLAAGTSMRPFWNLFKAHHHPEVYEMLEDLRIGNLSEDDAERAEKTSVLQNTDAAYADEPSRHPALVINSQEPFNAEPPASLLTASFETPNDLFFVRNHLPVPVLDDGGDNYTIELELPEGLHQLTLGDLKRKFPKHTVTATIQCAGNRRAEMHKVKAVKGLSWGESAISNAEWAGAKLSDVLAAAGVTLDDDSSHVQFEALDAGPDGERYGASIDLARALDPRKDVLLAYEMGGMPLPRDHGYPLRVIVPGVVGARNVKYLKKIAVATDESPSFWQQRDYKGFPPNVDYATPNAWEDHAGPSIQELPVTSAICEPTDGVVVNPTEDDLILRGYAWSGGGRAIIRVDVSIDGGHTWQAADLDQRSQPPGQAWAWTPWELVVDLTDVPDGVLNVCSKAVDDAYNSQPDSIPPIWNMRGLLNNAWFRSNVVIQRSSSSSSSSGDSGTSSSSSSSQ